MRVPSIFTKTVIALMLSAQLPTAHASAIVALYNPSAVWVAGGILLIPGGVLIIDGLRRGGLEGGAEILFGAAVGFGGIILDQKDGTLQLTSEQLGVDLRPLEGFYINPHLSEIQLFKSLQQQAAQRHIELSWDQLSTYAAALNKKAIEKKLSENLDRVQ